MLRNVVGFKSKCLPIPQLEGVRLLYSAESLGLNHFKAQRNLLAHRLSEKTTQETFVNRIQAFLSRTCNNEVYTDDLKNLAHLSNGTQEEVEILVNMLLRYQEKQKELLGSGFHFGPLVMRLLHHTSKPEAAYKMLLSPELAQTFFHFKSYQIGMDLLFRNQMYQEMVEVFSVLERRFIKLKQKNPSQQYPISCAVLYMAALYQLNTPESYREMLQVIEVAHRYGIGRMRRLLAYAAALAIRQDQPLTALRILSQTMQQKHFMVRNVRTLALARIGNWEETFRLIQDCIDDQSKKNPGPKSTICSDVFEMVQKAVQQSGDVSVQRTFSHLGESCLRSKCIDSRVLDEVLNSPIDWQPPSLAANSPDLFSSRYLKR